MNNAPIDKATFEAIEAYVLDRMSGSERAAFEQRLATDADLRKEVDLQQEHILAVELGGLLRTMQEAGRAHSSQVSGGRWPKLWGYAAMVAVIIAAAAWWLAHTPVNEQLYAEHFRPDPGLPVVMGATDDPAFADAMVSYKEGKYAEARAKWSPLLQMEPGNDTLRYYIAAAWMAEGDPASATPLLESLRVDRGSVFHGRINWYLFLAYVRAGEEAKARSIDLEQDTVYGDRVRSIMAQFGK